MKTFILLSLLCNFALPVQHSLKFILTSSHGVGSFPEHVAIAMVDEVQMGYCDSNTPNPKAKTDWMEKLIRGQPQHLAWYAASCLDNKHNFKDIIKSLMQRLNQTGGVHILQRMNGCEWNEETGEISGFMQYGYDGEDFIALDLKTSTWVAPKPQAVITKLKWDSDKVGTELTKTYLTEWCPAWLRSYLALGKKSLLRTERPSVSLLQKTPSSPVSCHATGFFPERSSLFWRKDGEEIHEDVDHGEILPNHDGTFQMSVDLNLSPVTPEDWRRYDCVFQLSGVKDDIVTRLDKDVFRTNREKLSDITIFIIARVVFAALLFIAATGFIVYKKTKGKSPPSSPDSCSELSERLNPDPTTRPD